MTCYTDGSVEKINGINGNLERVFGYCVGRRGGVSDCKYRAIHIAGKHIRIHRLIAEAFLHDYSEDLQVDHINNDRSDNRVENLRMATNAENQRAKIRKQKGTSSTYRGIYWCNTFQKWRATINLKRKRKFVGYFRCEQEAAMAWNEAAIEAGYFAEALNVIEQKDETLNDSK